MLNILIVGSDYEGKMKKLFGIIMIGALVGFTGCTINAKVENKQPLSEEKEEKIEEAQDGMEVIQGSLIGLKFSHCFDRVTLEWKNPDKGNFYRIVVSGGNERNTIEGLPGEEQSYVFMNMGKGYDEEFHITVYDEEDKVYTDEVVVTYAGHGKIESYGVTNLNRGDKLNLSYSPAGNMGILSEYFHKINMTDIVVVPPETNVLVSFGDDCGDCSKNFGKEVKIMKPYAMAKFELSLDDVEALKTSSYKQQNSKAYPKTNISFMEALVVCNQLTKNLLSEKDCVYYKDKECNTILDAVPSTSVFYVRPGAKGYRLPTWEEWEYAARGGNPNSKDWKNSYAGEDWDGEMLLEVAALESLCGSGEKKPNGLGIYDMTGNVREFVLDYVNVPLADRTESLKCYEYYVVGTCGGSYLNSTDSEEFLNSNRVLLTGEVNTQYGFIDYNLDMDNVGRDEVTGIRLVRSL